VRRSSVRRSLTSQTSTCSNIRLIGNSPFVTTWAPWRVLMSSVRLAKSREMNCWFLELNALKETGFSRRNRPATL